MLPQFQMQIENYCKRDQYEAVENEIGSAPYSDQVSCVIGKFWSRGEQDSAD
jgi:hypothetical protein